MALLAAAGIGVAVAQDDVADLRGEREDNRRDAADVAAQLDALTAEDADLVEALVAIDAHIALQEAKVDATLEAIVEAEAQAQQARDRAAGISDEIESVRSRLLERAVEAFIGPRNDAITELDTADIMAATLRRSFLDQIVGDEYELVDQLRVKVSEQQAAEQVAADLVAEVERERAQLEDRLSELADARAGADDLRVEVQIRIAEWGTIGADLEAADREIATQIQQLEAEAARQAAREEARRVAEEEQEARRAAEEEAAAEEVAAEEAAAAEESDVEEASANDPESATDPESVGDDEGASDEDAADAVAPIGDFAISHRPVPGSITSPFGERVHPIFGSVRSHFGIDFDGDRGDPILAAAAGTVLTAGWMNGYGNTVVISHGNGFATVYAHQTDLAVSTGATVSGGEVIGWVGSTGWSTGPHLHFEVRVEGIAVDPDPYLP